MKVKVNCRYASSAISTSIFGGENMTRMVSGLDCNGEEESLMDCDHDNFGDLFCPGEGLNDLAGVVCTDTQADLEPDLYQLMTSAYLEDKPLFLLQCAMEENCVAKQAYVERATNPYWQTHARRLLRYFGSCFSLNKKPRTPGSQRRSPTRALQTSDQRFQSWRGIGTPATSIIIPWRSCSWK